MAEVIYSRVRDEEVLHRPEDGVFSVEEVRLGPHVVQQLKTNVSLKIPEGQAVLLLPEPGLPFVVTPKVMFGDIPEVLVEVRSHRNHMISEFTKLATLYVFPAGTTFKAKR